MDEQTAFDLERETIKLFREAGHALTNHTDGGEGCSGRQADDAYRLKYHYMFLGENNPNYGNRWSDEQKHIASEKAKSRNWIGDKNPNAKRMMCVETGKIYSCQDEALKELGLASTNSFSIVKREPWRTARGFHWVFGELIDELDSSEKREQYLKSLSSPYNKVTGRTSWRHDVKNSE